MAASSRFIQSLRSYGARSAKNKARMEAWLEDAIEEIAANKGSDVVSGSANGASFSSMANMTNSEWFSCLDEALQMIDKGVNYTGKSFGQF